jgi:Acyltransferase family
VRAFVTLLVVVHHAVIAYNAFAPPLTASLGQEPRWWKALPIVDSQRSGVWAIFNAFNDGFFMALMFLISGLFVRTSLRGKGAGRFIRNRVLRLGIPFVLAAALIAPLAYYPTYLQRTTEASVGGFVERWLSLGEWPAGPAWFIWLLLAFDAAVALLLWLVPRWTAGVPSRLWRSPALFAAVLTGLSAVLVLPPMFLVGPAHWVAFGPFHFQTSRLGLYALYFIGGVLLGASGIERTFLGQNEPWRAAGRCGCSQHSSRSSSWAG